MPIHTNQGTARNVEERKETTKENHILEERKGMMDGRKGKERSSARGNIEGRERKGTTLVDR